MEVDQIGNIDDDREKFKNPQCGRVYNSDGLSPTLNTCQGGQREPKIIVAMRGRNPDDPSDRTAGSPTEQRLEPNSQGICNTLTSVQKDSLVLERVVDLYNCKIREDELCGTITSNGNTSSTHCGTFGVIEKQSDSVMIKQATKDGYIECKIGGVVDLSYPESNTRRGRVQEKGEASPTITATETGICRIESMYRIRKLTPIECWRLMGFSDDDFHKAEKVNSNSQLYKQAGNSIALNCLIAIFRNLGIKGGGERARNE